MSLIRTAFNWWKFINDTCLSYIFSKRFFKIYCKIVPLKQILNYFQNGLLLCGAVV